MAEDIQRYLDENDNGEVTPPILWEAAKAEIRAKMIVITPTKKRQKQKKLKDLQDKLKLLENQHAQSKKPQIFPDINR